MRADDSTRYSRRDRKQAARKARMPKHGRSLVVLAALPRVSRPAKKLANLSPEA